MKFVLGKGTTDKARKQKSYRKKIVQKSTSNKPSYFHIRLTDGENSQKKNFGSSIQLSLRQGKEI